nr:hypothetical protein [Tanacetum cinerariifolium]
MDMTIDEQVALDETLFFKAFLVTADVLEIYMREFWATVMVHHHSIRFKMDNKKHIVNLEYFREMLHIYPRLPGQTFDESPFEEEILAFLRFLGHNEEIKRLIDVNINKLHQPWRSFASINNKCLSGKSSGYDSLRLSQAHILWGSYRKRNVDFAYLLWEDFILQYQREIRGTGTMSEMIRCSLRSSWNSEAYKEYYAVATGATPPKAKASVRKTKSSSDTTVTPPPTATAGIRLFTSVKGKQPAKASKAKSLTALSEVAMTKAEQLKLATKRSLQQTHISQASGSGANKGISTLPGVLMYPLKNLMKKFVENPVIKEKMMMMKIKMMMIKKKGMMMMIKRKVMMMIKTLMKKVKNLSIPGNDEENLGLNVGREEGQDEEDDEDELYRDVNINLEGKGVQMADVHTTQEFEDSHVTLTPVNPDGQQQSSSMSSQFFAGAVSSIPGIVQRYMDQRMNEAVNVAVQIQSDRLCDEAQVDNEEFPKNLDENIQKIIKEQVKEQVKTSYAVAADLSEMELKKIFIEKIEGNKTIHRSNEQRNLYKALVEAYESDKIILDTYRDTVMLKRHRDDDADKDKETFAGSDWGSKRRREGNEPDSVSAPKEKATRSAGKSTQGSKSRQTFASESATAEDPMQTTQEIEEPSHLEFETGADDQPIVEPSQHPECELAKQTDSRSYFNELMDTHVDFSAFLMNRLKVETLTPELLVGPTYELMKGSCKSLVELEFFLEEVYKETTDQLDWINPERLQYPHNLLKPLPLIPNSRGVESYQKKLNLTKLDTYRSDLKSKESYTAYSNPRGFIYQNKDKQNRLMRIDELHKFNDGTLNDVQTALDDRLKRIQMKYLPQTIWKRSDTERATAMI